MKTLLKVLAGLLVLLVLVIGAGLTYLNTGFPKVSPATDLKVEPTAELLERGAYLANHVTVCIDCHSQRDWTKFSAPIVEGTEGKGGEFFPKEAGFPGNFYAKNITPHAIGDWTDGELFRAFTSGVSKNGEPFFPLMPYLAYQSLSETDAHAILAYIRSLKPIENDVPPSKLDFPMNFIVRTIPQDYSPKPAISPNDSLKYGEYLVKIAACGECHTPQDKGKAIEGKYFAGGFKFPLPKGGWVLSSNITPHNSGIGRWTAEQFVQKFKSYTDSSYQHIPVKDGEYNTVMPWTMYGGMSESDLRSIFKYLQTLEPVDNKVEKFIPPSS